MQGFFSKTVLATQKLPLPLLPKCGACGLFKGCNSPKMPVSGKGRRKVLVVGEAPGADEDAKGLQFVGKAGQRLKDTLSRLKVDLREDCWVTNALICRPEANKIDDQDKIEFCRPNLVKTVEELKPETIVLLGKSAVKSVIGHLWKEDVGEVGRWVGWKVPCQKWNCWIHPTYHPSYVMRMDGHQVVDRMFKDHLRAAFSHDRRPWKQVPDYRSKVRVVWSAGQACDLIKTISKPGRGPVAVDYETTMLKPDSKRSEVVCCSLSNGRMTFAFPWTEKVVPAMKEFFRSDVPKIASNMKFEHRWTKRVLGCEVRNWFLDTALAAHVIDNRPEIASIKFQAFVLLGQGVYDDHIRPYLESKDKGGYARNNVKDCDMEELMVYCGLDSLLEWLVAKRQAKVLNVPWPGDPM